MVYWHILSILFRGCWCPGALRRQVINSHGIQYLSLCLVISVFSEFRLYWWIRVLDSVKCPSYLTNYKAFSATKTPWVELCFGSVGEKLVFRSSTVAIYRTNRYLEAHLLFLHPVFGWYWIRSLIERNKSLFSWTERLVIRDVITKWAAMAPVKVQARFSWKMFCDNGKSYRHVCNKGYYNSQLMGLKSHFGRPARPGINVTDIYEWQRPCLKLGIYLVG